MTDATSITEEQAIAALAVHLEIPEDDIEVQGWSDRTQYDAGGLGEFLILTDQEADSAVREYVRDSVWAFNASFLASETDLPEAAFKALQSQYEDANEPILAMVEQTVDGGLDAFADEAVSADGRGHFLAQYDGQEVELDTPAGRVYAYRVN